MINMWRIFSLYIKVCVFSSDPLLEVYMYVQTVISENELILYKS